MSTPDYPLLTVPGYELYQLAHLTTFVVDALARHRRAAEASDRVARRVAPAGEIPTDATDAGPARAPASPGGFAAAAAALPDPSTTPPHGAAAVPPENSSNARLAPPVTARLAQFPRQTPIR
jgi:hypothetical protein